MIFTAQVSRHGHANRRGYPRAGMAGAEVIVFALLAHQEPGDAAFLPNGAQLLSSARNHLMGIRLMSGVPNDFVARAIEDAMQGDGELDRTEIGRKVSARLRNACNKLFAQLPRYLR